MSGVFKFAKKVFKKIVKVVKKVLKSKIFKVLLVSAAVWFTAGVASGVLNGQGFFAAAKASATNIWTTTTNFLTGGTASAGGASGGAGNYAPVTDLSSAYTGPVINSAGAISSGGAASGGGIINGIGNAITLGTGNAKIGAAVLGGIGNAAKGYSDRESAKDAAEIEANHGLFGVERDGTNRNQNGSRSTGIAGSEISSVSAPSVERVVAPTVNGGDQPTGIVNNQITLAPPPAPQQSGKPVVMSDEELARLGKERA